jgi:hypothetical protein
MLNSHYKSLGPATLPPWQGRRRYMHGFDLAAPRMAAGYEDYLPVVTALCAAAGATAGKAYMTVDEKLVAAGSSQRRPGPHVDGQYIPSMEGWKHQGGWNHVCNSVPLARMPVIVAASVAGCVAWQGQFDAQPTPQGDLSHIAGLLGLGQLLTENHGWWLSPDCVHESMVFRRPTQRTFLRIALPVEA